MAGQLDSIVELQKVLAELNEAENRLAGIPEWMRELHEEHSARQAQIDAVAATGEEAARQRRTAETELSEAQEKLRQFQEQIGRVSTQREYGAVLKEIDTVKGRIAELEQGALESLERHEQAQAELAELRDAFRDLDTRYRAELEKWEGEKPAVARLAGELRSRDQALRQGIPRRVQVLFDRLFERYQGQAVARVLKVGGARGPTMWHCEQCNYRVRPQAVVEIRNHGSLTQCDSCKRILYHDEGAA